MLILLKIPMILVKSKEALLLPSALPLAASFYPLAQGPAQSWFPGTVQVGVNVD